MTQQAGQRRTPLGHRYDAAPAASPFVGPGGPSPFGHPLAGASSGQGLMLFDLTAWDRFGLKGRGAGDWLVGKGLGPLPQINTMSPAPASGPDILRLGTEDIVLLSRPETGQGGVARLRAEWEADARRPKGFNAWRDETWAWFHIRGPGVSELMARTCPVDLHRDRFAPRCIAQTRVAQMDCIVVRSDRDGLHGFDLFFDVASSEFMLRSFEELGAP